MATLPIPLDRFLPYDELTALLHNLVEAHPDLLEITSLTTTDEGRDVWLLTVSNQRTGSHGDKPAVWIDANIHAAELAGSVAALAVLRRLIDGHGTDDRVTRALDTRTFYLVPRLSPDGADAALADDPRYVRSSMRPYPLLEQQDGLVPGDVDGDGRILSMRIEDPNGTWKPDVTEPRLLVPRDPDEDGPGPYYRLLTEGRVQNFDGTTITPAPALAGLDINRNYPYDWRPDGDQGGAGPFPASEPEIRACLEAIVERRNICVFHQYHTYSGVHLRPSSNKSDEELPTNDLWLYERLGELATAATDYPVVSVFHGFRYHPKEVITGVSMDWAYDHRGLVAWVTEFWNPLKSAGIDTTSPLEWAKKHPIEDEHALLAWCDDLPDGDGFVDWQPFDHPELGKVEIGGWDTALIWQNPPPSMLEAEVIRHADWAVSQALMTPLLRTRAVTVDHLEGDTWRIRLVVENSGFLSTAVTERAVDRKVVRPLEAELVVSDGDTVEVIGDRKVELGQLAGRALRRSSAPRAMDGTDDRVKVDWVVRAPAGTTIELVARHERAGVVRETVTLKA